MDESSLLSALRILNSASTDLPVDVINNCSDQVNAIQTSYEGFEWAMQTLPDQTNDLLAIFACNIIHTFIVTNWNHTTQATKVEIQTLLFNPLLWSQLNIQHELTRVQTAFVFFLPLSEWVTFFEGLIEMDEPFLMYFFVSVMNTISSDLEKYSMYLSELQNSTILSSLIALAELSNTEIAYKLIAECIVHVTGDITDIINREMIQKVIKALDDSRTVESAMKILRVCLVETPLQDMVFDYNIPEKLSGIIDSYNSNEILSVASSLVYCLGTYNLDNQEFFDLAMKIVIHPNELVVINVLLYIQFYLENHQDVIPEYFYSLFQRYMESFEVYDECGKKQFEEKFTRVIAICVRYRPQMLTQMISEYKSDNPQFNAALFTLLLYFHNEFYNFSVNAFDFSAILDYSAPLQDNQAKAFISFCEYFVRKSSTKDSPDGFYNALFFQALCPQNSPYIRHELVDIIESISDTNPALTDFLMTNNIINRLMNIWTEDSLRLAFKMIDFLPEPHKGEAYSEILSIFERSVQEFTPRMLSFTLSLIREQGAVNGAADASIRFLNETFQYVTSNDDLFGLYIQTAYSCLHEKCFPILDKCCFVAKDVVPITALLKVSQHLLKNGLSLQWSEKLIEYHIDNVVSLLNEVSDWTNNSQETNEGRMFLMEFFGLCGSLCRSLSSDLLEKILDIASIMLKNGYEIPAILFVIIRFLSVLPSELSHTLCDRFLELSLHMIDGREFLPSLPDWRKIIKELGRFHLKLRNNIGDEFDEKLAKIWAASPQMLEEYIDILDGGVGTIDAKCPNFFYNLVESMRY